MKTFGKVLLGGAALIAVPTAMMESHQEGSSVEYRQSSIEGVHSGIEAVTLTATDLANQVGPFTQTLAQQLGLTLQSTSAVLPAGSTATTAPATQLPGTLANGLPDPGAAK